MARPVPAIFVIEFETGLLRPQRWSPRAPPHVSYGSHITSLPLPLGPPPALQRHSPGMPLLVAGDSYFLPYLLSGRFP